jgi:hypothetical protein
MTRGGSSGSTPEEAELPEVDRAHLPTFMVIGAAKCGTTSLHSYLAQHPSISMSSVKETNFFQNADCMTRLREYQKYFQDGCDQRGESSHRYTWFPCLPDIPERIWSVLPDLKLIYLVRDPIDRAEAHYNEQWTSDLAPASIGDAFMDLEGSVAPWVWASKYALQVEQYMRYFPRKSLMIVDSEDLRVRRRDTLRALFSFLGVDPHFYSTRFNEELNARNEPKLSFTPRGRLLRYSPAAEAARSKLPPRLRRPFFAVARRPFLRPASRQQRLSPETRRRLAQFLREDTERFREFAGRPFDHWSL